MYKYQKLHLSFVYGRIYFKSRKRSSEEPNCLDYNTEFSGIATTPTIIITKWDLTGHLTSLGPSVFICKMDHSNKNHLTEWFITRIKWNLKYIKDPSIIQFKEILQLVQKQICRYTTSHEIST